MEQAPQLTNKFLHAPAFGRGRTSKLVAEMNDAKSRVARLVAEYQFENIPHQRIGTVALEYLKDSNRDSFEKDLHSDDLLTVVIGLQQAPYQVFEWRINRGLDT